MAANRAGLKKVTKTVRGKKGVVRRSYWVKANPNQKSGQRSLRQEGAPKQGFLARHGGKLAVGAALLGAAALNRHKLMGAARGAGLALNAHKHSGQNTPLVERARDAFRMAKVGYGANRGMDRIDKHTANISGRVRDWRRKTGSDLAAHLTGVGGHAALEYAGGRAGGAAGSAIGGVLAGPVGAQLGGFIGGHAGSFLATRHGSRHVISAAERLAQRMRR